MEYIYKYELNNNPVYIGITNNIDRRLSQHGICGDNIDKCGWDEINAADIYYAEMPNRTMADCVESILIQKYKPKYNKAKVCVWDGLDISEPKWKKYIKRKYAAKQIRSNNVVNNNKEKKSIINIDCDNQYTAFELIRNCVDSCLRETANYTIIFDNMRYTLDILLSLYYVYISGRHIWSIHNSYYFLDDFYNNKLNTDHIKDNSYNGYLEFKNGSSIFINNCIFDTQDVLSELKRIYPFTYNKLKHNLIVVHNFNLDWQTVDNHGDCFLNLRYGGQLPSNIKYLQPGVKILSAPCFATKECNNQYNDKIRSGRFIDNLGCFLEYDNSIYHKFIPNKIFYIVPYGKTEEELLL